MMLKNIVLDAKNYVQELLEGLYSKGYFFHNLDHTLDVYQRAEYLSNKEGLSDSDKELLLLAALFHDTGFLYSYDDNEKIGAEIADKYLSGLGYPQDKIYIIKQNILATIPFRKPSNILEEIIKDSDLDNLGRLDCFERSSCLRKELLEIKGKSFIDNDWTVFLYNFLEKQNFYVKTQIQERQSTLDKNKKFIKEEFLKII